MTAIQLRDYQQVAVDEVRAEFRKKNYPVLFVLPTGGGKSYTFCFIAASAAALRRHVIIVVHRKELLLQASASLRNLGIEHGLISPFFTPDRTKLIQIASIDTLLIRLKKGEYQCGLLIVDEAHHCITDNKWGRVYELLGRPPMLGVTATPVRSDGKGLGEHAGGLFKSMVLGPMVAELIERGMLVKPTVFTSLDMPDMEGIKPKSNGDYSLQDLASRVDKPKITGSAVEHYTRICPGAKTIVFCTSIEHAKHVVAQFNEAGYRFALLVGEPEMSDAQRTAVNKALRRGDIDGACTVDLVSEGYDLPALECCIMLRRTMSEALFLQQAGRIMRPDDAKRGCWLLDHVGNIGMMIDGEFKANHGFPWWDRDWTLDGREKKGKGKKQDEEPAIELKQCPKCFLVQEPAPACAHCGHIFPTNARTLEQVDGELQQVTEEMEQRMATQRRMEQGKAQTKEALEALGIVGKRADKILEHRIEKRAMANALVADLETWRDQTGQTAFGTFGVAMSDIRSLRLKPKEMKQLRERFESHKAAHFNANPELVSGEHF